MKSVHRTLLLLLWLCMCSPAVWALTQTRTPGSCANVGGIGTVPWVNATRAVSSNNSYATRTVDGTTSNYLRCLSYGFSIPLGSTINGVTVNVERRANSTANGGSRDAAMRLVKAGVIGTTDRATATIYPTTDTLEIHGSASDLWGTTWSVADINAANFGAAIASTKPSAAGPTHVLSVDVISITVDYTLGAIITETRPPGTCVNIAGIGTAVWGNAARAVSSNNSYASRSLDGTTSQFLRCTNYGFALPVGAVVNSISVLVERRANSTANGGSRDAAMRLVKAGVIGTTDRSTATLYPTADTVEAHGVVNDLWGTTWSAAEINAINFGAAFASTKPSAAGPAQTVSVDVISIAVTYTVDTTPPTVSSIVRANPNPTTAPSVAWTITFSESVTGVAASNFSLVNIGLTGPAITSVVGGGGVWTVTASTGSDTGTLGLNLTSLGVIRDLALNPLSAMLPVVGEVYTINRIANFDAVETGAAPATRLYTKLAGTAFSIDILALNAGGSISIGYRGQPVVDLVDASSSASCSAMVALQNIPISPFSAGEAGRKPVTLTYNNAVANAKIRIADSFAGSTACSSDSFSIRPTQINSVSSTMTNTSTTGTPRAAAGSGLFGLTANIGLSGYNGTPKIDNGGVQAHVGAVQTGVINGNFSPASAGAANGATFSYSEVGHFRLLGAAPSAGSAAPRGVYDDTFTNIDALVGDCTPDFSNTVVGGRVGCQFGLVAHSTYFGRFHPHAFVLSAASLTHRMTAACAAASTFSYLDEPMRAQFTLTAMNGLASPTVTRNYTGAPGPASFAKLDLNDPASYSLGGIAGSAPFGARLLATTASGSWVQGIASDISIDLRALRNATPDGPHNLRLGIAPNDGDAGMRLPYDLDTDFPANGNDRTELTGSMLPATLRFGRLRLANAAGSHVRSLALPVTANYFDGTAFSLNTLDNCTTIPATAVSFGNYRKGIGAGDTQIAGSSITLNNGMAKLVLQPPATPGTFDMAISLGSVATPDTSCLQPWTPGGGDTATTGANLSYLRGAWCGSSYNNDPAARASFGIYRGADNLIFQRENY